MLGVPLAVLGSATGPYDDPKAWALPILVAGTGLAWMIWHREELGRPESSPDRMNGWVRGIVAIYGLWWVITTLASLALGQSLFGNFGRGLGLVTFGSAILLFPLVRSECRSPRAVRGLIDAALLGSAPVCLLAFGQVLGWDPLPKAWDPAVASLNVRSTFGQHIFLGSYLVALIPLALARLSWGLRDRGPDGQKGDSAPGSPKRCVAVTAAWTAGAVGLVVLGPTWNLVWWLLVPWGVIGAVAWGLAVAPHGATPWLPPALVALLLASQVLVVFLSQARGAFFGMLAGLSVTAIGLLVRRRAWQASLWVAGGLVAVALFLVLLNLPGSPLAPLRSVPLLSRLSSLTDVQTGTPGWFRLRVWLGTLDGWRRQLGGEVFIPGSSPQVRSLVGYGLETQLVTLDGFALSRVGLLRADGEGWHAQYVVDRAHNIVLDHLVTGGLIGVGLWALLIGSLFASGVARARAATAPGERAVRIGALGAVVAHLVEEQVGILTPMPLALFWVAAALCTMPSWSERPDRSGAPPRRRTPWVVAVITAALLTGLVAWFETRWLLASVAYADGSRSGMAGRRLEAYQHFQRSRALVPWLVLPAEAAAYSALRLAAAETHAVPRLALLREADAALAAVGHHAGTGATYWTLSAQVAFAQVRAGQRGKLEASLDAFEHAARLRPRDWQLMTQWAWALLEAGDPARARATVQQALAEPQGAKAWLAWAVLARATKDLGSETEAKRAAVNARRLAPPEADRILESLGLLPE
jgi:hypothetical protein